MAINAIYYISIKQEKGSENGPILIRIGEEKICAREEPPCKPHKGTLDQTMSNPKSPASHTTVCSVPPDADASLWRFGRIP